MNDAFVRRFSFPLILLAGALIRIPYLVFWDIYFSSDTGVLGLMVRRFLEGDPSLYYWGEGYYGSLDSLLMMPVFKLLGSTPRVLQLSPFLCAAALLWCYHSYVKRAANLRVANLSTLVLALCPPYFLNVNVIGNNYVITFILGLLHFRLVRDCLREAPSKKRFFLLGALAGFSWFFYKLIVVFWLASGVYYALERFGAPLFEFFRNKTSGITLRSFWSEVLLLRSAPLPSPIKGFLVLVNFFNAANVLFAGFLWVHGDLSFWLGNLKVGLFFGPVYQTSLLLAFAVFCAVRWRSVPVWSRAAFSHPDARPFLLGFALGYSPAILGAVWGCPPASGGRLVTLPELANNLKLFSTMFFRELGGMSGLFFAEGISIAVVLLGLFMVFRLAVRSFRKKMILQEPLPDTFPMLAFAFAALAVGLLGVGMIDRPSLRYLSPLYLPVAFGIASLLDRLSPRLRWAAFVVLFFYLLNNTWANIRVWETHQNPNPYQQVADQCLRGEIKGGYADYWTAYYVTFLTQEKSIIVPVGDKDRYPDYLKYVQSLPQVALIGEAAPLESRRSIKGVEYRAKAHQVWNGKPVTLLEKISL